MRKTSRDIRRSHLDRPTEPAWTSEGSYVGTECEAFDAELAAILMGIRHMAQRQATNTDPVLFTDPQAAMKRI